MNVVYLRRAAGAAVLAAALALATACQPGSGTTGGKTKAGGTTIGNANGKATGGTKTNTGTGQDASDFCALVKAKGIANTLDIEDTTSDDTTAVLANLDEVTAAAPPDIKPAFETLDQLEHQILGANPDPNAYAKFQDPEVVAALHQISAYLADPCHITA